LVAESEGIVYSSAPKIVLGLALLVSLLSLGGIIFLFVFQKSQDDQVLSAVADMRREFGNEPTKSPISGMQLGWLLRKLGNGINGIRGGNIWRVGC
jgi:hypothetical protein